MSDKPEKEVPVVSVPKDLPMPRYDYQRPSWAGSVVVPYDESLERERQRPDDVPALQNIQFSV